MNADLEEILRATDVCTSKVVLGLKQTDQIKWRDVYDFNHLPVLDKHALHCESIS